MKDYGKLHPHPHSPCWVTGSIPILQMGPLRLGCRGGREQSRDPPIPISLCSLVSGFRRLASPSALMILLKWMYFQRS